MSARPSEDPPPSSQDLARNPPPLPRGPLVLMAIGALFCLVILGFSIRHRLRSHLAAPPVFSSVPAFERPDQLGHNVTADSLRGSVWVADFFFTSCPTACPKLAQTMSSVQERLKRAGERRGKPMPVHLVSFSVDPDNDTTEKRVAFARRFGADDAVWSFLGGTSADVDRIVVQGFKINVERQADDTGVFTIMHGEWFVVVDKLGRIRGYYDTKEPARLDDLLNDVERLVDERPVVDP